MRQHKRACVGVAFSEAFGLEGGWEAFRVELFGQSTDGPKGGSLRSMSDNICCMFQAGVATPHVQKELKRRACTSAFHAYAFTFDVELGLLTVNSTLRTCGC